LGPRGKRDHEPPAGDIGRSRCLRAGDSLFSQKNSLFAEINSLFYFLGNFPASY